MKAFLLVTVFALAVSAAFGTHLDDIKKQIFKDYDVHARPSNDATNMDISLSATHFDIDEDKHIFTMFGWMRMVSLGEKRKKNICF
jgi:hypothetical protein